MAGMVLKDLDYTDLERFGRVTIEYTSRGAEVTVDGFEFSGPASCREHVGKALSWARDVLNVEIEAVRLIPGGHLMSSTGMTQSELDSEESKWD